MALKPFMSAQTKERFLWCLALQAQGPTAALTFTRRAQSGSDGQAGLARAADLAVDRRALRLSKGACAEPVVGVSPRLSGIAPTRIHGSLAA